MAGEIKYLDAREFREGGYLQEVNRLVLHPVGLAMEVVRNDDGTERLGGVWDYRDDPEGIYFGDGVDEAKAERVRAEMLAKTKRRLSALGYVVQPVRP
jgi:hypothetical protein